MECEEKAKEFIQSMGKKKALDYVKRIITNKHLSGESFSFWQDVHSIIELYKSRKKGGGRKPEYNEPTDTITFRVPISHKESIKRIVKEYLNKLKK